FRFRIVLRKLSFWIGILPKKRLRLWGSHVNWIRKHPESRSPPAAKSGLAQKNFGAVAARAGDGLVDDPAALLVNLTAVAKYLDQRDAWAGRRGNSEAR